MTPPLLVGLGVLAIGLGAAVLRTFGPGFRIGRLLSAAPLVSVGEALALAAAGRARYVRVEGRIDASEPFEDDAGRPLVHRRVRLELREGRRWRAVADERRTVAFALSQGLDTIPLEAEALGDGLVVIQRESIGVAGDAPDLAPGTDPALPARLRVEHVSSVDHAIACGVPRPDGAGGAILGPGLGRPLVLTTLGRDDAVRVLAGGSRIRPLLAGLALATGLLLIAAGLGIGVMGSLTSPVAAAVPGDTLPGRTLGAAPTASPTAAAPSATPASPSATPAAPSATPAAPADDTPLSGDTRSTGEGPSFIGAPLLAIGGMLGIGLGAAGLTLLYVRLTARRGR